jgi:oxygen-independent coproporphyrinogen-3 oxidase
MVPKPTYPTGIDTNTSAGLYLHIPFCRTKCPYCDFFSSTNLERLPAIVDALAREAQLRATDALFFDTIYFGGGTPSLLAGRMVARLLALLRECFHILPGTEITLEANPGSLTPARLDTYREAGVNRLNIGVQSFQKANLGMLGRSHSAAQSRAAIANARSAGFTNIGLDLIYGLPGQTAATWRRDLDTALATDPDHLSCYLLTFEAGTRFEIRRRRGELLPLAADTQAALFQMTRSHLAAAGYPAYEISNFARDTAPDGPDLRSRHNLKYWNHHPYLGLGPAAHSYRHPQRSWNEKRLQRYLECIEKGERPLAASERLTTEQARIEALYLGLRQTRGLDSEAYARRFGESFATGFDRPLRDLIEGGQMVWDAPYYRLTEAGFAVADGVVAHLISAGPTAGAGVRLS